MDPDELYCLPLDRFVPERAALVKALRAEGRREDASDVAKLPKPSVAAWAVNQVVRAQSKQAAALWSAGDDVIETQARVVAGKAGGKELRGAIERQRAALEPLADAARGLVTAGDKFLGEAHVQAVVETLHAASVDAAAREDVAAARVARPLRLTGLEAVASVPAPPRAAAADPKEDAPPRKRRAKAAKAANEPASDAARARIAAREQRDAEAEAERRAAEKERAAREREARRALARAERDRDAARDRVQAAVKARADAEIRVEQAEADLARAENFRADAHAELEQAEDAVELARAEVDALD